MPLERLEQLANRPVMRNRIRHRHDSLEPELAVGVALQHRASLGRRPVRVLHVVEALAVGLPDVDLGVRDRPPGGVAQCAQHQTGLALRVVGDGRAVVFGFGVVCVEGP